MRRRRSVPTLLGFAGDFAEVLEVAVAPRGVVLVIARDRIGDRLQGPPRCGTRRGIRRASPPRTGCRREQGHGRRRRASTARRWRRRGSSPSTGGRTPKKRFADRRDVAAAPMRRSRPVYVAAPLLLTTVAGGSPEGSRPTGAPRPSTGSRSSPSAQSGSPGSNRSRRGLRHRVGARLSVRRCPAPPPPPSPPGSLPAVFDHDGGAARVPQRASRQHGLEAMRPRGEADVEGRGAIFDRRMI